MVQHLGVMLVLVDHCQLEMKKQSMKTEAGVNYSSSCTSFPAKL